MLTGIILAGGRSRRMGADKALLHWQGGTMLEHAKQLLVDVGCKQVLVSRNAPGYVQDIYPDMGPLAGLHACLNRCQCDQAIVIPIDMPLLSSACLSDLISQGSTLKKSCFYSASVLPCYLTGLPQLTATTHSRLIQNQLSVHGFLSAIDACAIERVQHVRECALMNTNTPEQWAFANQIMQQEIA
ncbi:molybdenum cofactor guanylyltransferase [Pseudoalteromonas sp. T1lg23B]|uniref:molybdenum cofactor guanylyltransferase n=1 Tax=Pseudoalteromonas sp. T1lg23B TaxID=2077097 RepID=UPI000CF72304|nr:molybdenum cofactor guanylyltransferase [Pseudoalteromonas sp. T1lg23B]